MIIRYKNNKYNTYFLNNSVQLFKENFSRTIIFFYISTKQMCMFYISIQHVFNKSIHTLYYDSRQYFVLKSWYSRFVGSRKKIFLLTNKTLHSYLIISVKAFLVLFTEIFKKYLTKPRLLQKNPIFKPLKNPILLHSGRSWNHLLKKDLPRRTQSFLSYPCVIPFESGMRLWWTRWCSSWSR